MGFDGFKNRGDARQCTDGVTAVYYTDPLCCWSWALEANWQKLIAEYGERFSYSYCMGGMIPDWTKFQDPLNAVSRPVQMGPVWMEARHLTGTQIDDSIWVKDPPSSSYPACIAVKAAGLQSKVAEELFLRRIWQAVMTEARNVARADVLLDLAQESSRQFPKFFDFAKFAVDYSSQTSRQAFRDDLAKTRYQQIGRFPSITFSQPGGKTVLITGYRPYNVLVDALKAIMPQPSDFLSY